MGYGTIEGSWLGPDRTLQVRLLLADYITSMYRGPEEYIPTPNQTTSCNANLQLVTNAGNEEVLAISD